MRPAIRSDDGAAEMARLAGSLADRTRAAFCLALLDGRAWTAGELARHGGVARSTATAHLDRLVDDGLLVEERQGRHRYVRLADHEAAELVEHLSARAPQPVPVPASLRDATKHAALARGRTCYDHLAGALGVGVTEAMTDRRLLDGWTLTATGRAWLVDLGVDVEAARAGRRPFVRSCLDWTERRPHLAGAIGAALCRRCFDAQWVERIGSGRAVRLTPTGRRVLSASLQHEF
ncbi:MAG TPA: winged helix-turn-helix domain-containing protein [Jatrophihabitantaceae bacterium]|jgi:DNA-binding transcriptional ArsR family regulator